MSDVDYSLAKRRENKYTADIHNNPYDCYFMGVPALMEQIQAYYAGYTRDNVEVKDE